MELHVRPSEKAVRERREDLLLLARPRCGDSFEGALHQRLEMGREHRRQLAHERAKPVRGDRAILHRLPQDHDQQLGFTEVEAALAAARRALGNEPVPLPPDERQPHVRTDNVEVRLHLPFA